MAAQCPFNLPQQLDMRIFIFKPDSTGMQVQVISGPIASGILLADGAAGLKGWQWLFLLEGLPTILLGVWVGSPTCCSRSSHLSQVLQPNVISSVD